jgi:hypothetical protein
MGWTAVSAAGGRGANEDLVAVHEHESAAAGVTDILVMDGATSVAQQHAVDTRAGDVAWFVRRFADSLASVLVPDASQQTLVMRAAALAGADWLARTEGLAVPAYAWPIAALSWIRVFHGRDADTLHLYALGDCKVLLRTRNGAVRDLDPWVNPQEAVLQAAIAGLLAEGVSDPAARKERLLPLLRRRREEQNAAPEPSVLCLRPAGPFAARCVTLEVAHGATLLGMTDGFYRLADPYRRYAPAQLVEACAARGLDATLAELRALEAGGGGPGLAVKAADDASAVMWTN